MWSGHGASPRPREAEWSSGLAAVFWACYNENIFKDPNDYHDYDASVLYKDMVVDTQFHIFLWQAVRAFYVYSS